MSSKMYSQYKFLHLNGQEEKINALSLSQALANLSVPESESLVTQVSLEAQGIKTILDDAPINWQTVVSPVDAGTANPACFTFPSSGTTEIGNEASMVAVAKGNYHFDHWDVGGQNVGTEETLKYTMTALAEDETEKIFKAVFAENNAPTNWKTAVSPDGAGTANCFTFPASGTTDIGSTASMVAVAKGDYHFDHWDVGGTNVGTEETLNYTMTAPAEGTTEITFTAVFALNNAGA